MDDGRLPSEMSAGEIAKQLAAMNAQFTAINERFDAVDEQLKAARTRDEAIEAGMQAGFLRVDEQLESARTRVDAIEAGMQAGFLRSDEQLESARIRVDAIEAVVQAGFRRVDEQLNAARIRDEQAHDLLKFSLEAREGLRESMEKRFDATGKKQDEEIGLLKDVLRHVAGTRNERHR